jgi:hypothetical protein
MNLYFTPSQSMDDGLKLDMIPTFKLQGKHLRNGTMNSYFTPSQSVDERLHVKLDMVPTFKLQVQEKHLRNVVRIVVKSGTGTGIVPSTTCTHEVVRNTMQPHMGRCVKLGLPLAESTWRNDASDLSRFGKS